jgi:D-alanine transaminase
MPRYAYVNGRYLPHHRARVHIEDRGYQLADGVYEVVPLYRGRLIDEEPHLDRFDYSLGELKIAPPMSRAALRLVLRELVRRNGISDGALYFQATRGVAAREHRFPAKAKTAFVATLRRARPPTEKQVEHGVSVIAIPDIRWKRCDIKAIGLLPNALGKQRAVDAGAFEAWQIDEQGRVTEGTTTNAWIVSGEGALVTRDAGAAILNGITRRSVLDLVAKNGMRLEERPFSLAEAFAAHEAFITSSSAFVLPVVSIDGRKVGDGKPGPIARRLRELFIARALETPPI